MRRTFAGLASVVVLGGAALLACAADHDGGDRHAGDDGGGGAPTDTPPGPGGSESPPGSTVSPQRRELPLAIPSLGGFTLVDAFPDVDIPVPSALVWPKAPGAAPLVLLRQGTVVQIAGGNARTVLDFSGNVSMVSEAGALGMALHPDFGDGSGGHPYAYVWYNASGSKQRLSRFTWSAANGAFDAGSELVLVEETEQAYEHNAGRVAFGPDGFLYFGNGDDLNTANHQRIDRALFAGIFRIDVDSKGGTVSHPPPRQPEGGYTAGYFIPNDNPFVGVAGALEEFYALGFRNPFGFSFDRQTGALWVGDVGDTWREEVDLVVKGGNYEWPYREGELLRGTVAPTIGAAHGSTYAYSHASMGDLTAILGGFVYRGKELPELVGKYIYSDWPSSRIWALDVAKTKKTRTTLIDNQWKLQPLALAEDDDGEIYLLHLGGISRLVRDANRPDVPRRLSETTLFSDVAGLVPDPKLVPYEIASPLWSDGAVKKRWIYVPPGKTAALADDGSLELPASSMLVKQFDLPPSITPQGRGRRLETRILVVGTETTYGLTYRWNAQGTDADLVLEDADEAIRDVTTGQTRNWHYPGFGQCWSCHRSENRVLGFAARQLALTTADGKPQLEVLAARGVFDPAAISKFPPALARPSDTSASLEARATAYLAANCSGCHHAGASYLGGGPTWNASPDVPLGDRGLVGAPHHNTPMAMALGMTNAPLIDPGSPETSVLLGRIKTNNPDLRMPPLARNVVDQEGAALIEQWIRSMPKD